MAHNIVYVLVEVDNDESEEEVKARIEAADPTFFVASTATVSMKHLEEAGTPVIYFP